MRAETRPRMHFYPAVCLTVSSEDPGDRLVHVLLEFSSAEIKTALQTNTETQSH